MSKTATPVSSVPYNKDVLSLLNDLCAISESIIIKKDKDDKGNPTKKLAVQRSNSARSIVYRLSMDSTAFNFTGDSVSFYKFPEFFQLLSCMEEPELTQTDDKLVIAKDKSKINYVLSDAETLPKGPSNIKFSNSQVEFELKSSDIKELKKMIGLLTAKNTRFTCAKNKVDVTCYNSSHDNSFTKTYNTKKCTQDLSFSIPSDVFPTLPDGDYQVELVESITPNKKTVCMVKFTLQKKDISLEIFTAELDEE